MRIHNILVIGLIIVLMIVGTASATCNYPLVDGDWIITTDESCLNETIKVRGNVTVNGATLTLENTSLQINGSGYADYKFNVSVNATSSLVLNNSSFLGGLGAYKVEIFGNMSATDSKYAPYSIFYFHDNSVVTWNNVTNGTAAGNPPYTGGYQHPFFEDSSNSTIINSILVEPRFRTNVVGAWFNVSGLTLSQTVPNNLFLNGTALKVNLSNTYVYDLEVQHYYGNIRYVNITGIIGGDIYMSNSGVVSSYWENVNITNFKDITAGKHEFKNANMISRAGNLWVVWNSDAIQLNFTAPYSNFSNANKSTQIYKAWTMRGYIDMPDINTTTLVWNVNGMPLRYFPVYSNWSNGTVYPNAIVTVINNSNGIEVSNITTDSNGYGNTSIRFGLYNYSYNNFTLRIWNGSVHENKSDINFFTDTISDIIVSAENDITSSLTYIPPTPINLAQTNSSTGFWINYTWEAGAGNVTDSYNVSVNGTWDNTSSNNWSNGTVNPHGWRNISVYAYNSSGTGTLNTTGISQNKQVNSTYIPPSPVSCTSINGTSWINITCSAGSGNSTDGMNFTNINTSIWNNGTNFYWNNTGLSGLTIYTYHVYSWNNSGLGTLNLTYTTVTNTTQASGITTSTITVPANSWGMFNNWSWNTNFSNIASNESNDISYTFYNVTSGEWNSYYPGYTAGATTTINKNNSVLGFFNAQTTITAATVTPWNTSITEGWNMLYLMGTANKTLSTIKANITANGCDPWELYEFNSTSNDYDSTSTNSIQPNTGFLVYVNATCTWTRTTI